MLKMLRDTDPVYSCELYMAEGCCHVDGLLCDFPKCSMLEEYREEMKLYEPQIEKEE